MNTTFRSVGIFEAALGNLGFIMADHPGPNGETIKVNHIEGTILSVEVDARPLGDHYRLVLSPHWFTEAGRINPYQPIGKDGQRTDKWPDVSKLRYFVVEGDGDFPVDMLRYDVAWAITGIGHPQDCLQPRRSVVCATITRSKLVPTEGRWSSFGWVVKERHIRPPYELLQGRI